MDFPASTGGNPEQKQEPVIEYTAQADSPLVNGEVKLTINETALLITALFDTAEIPFADVTALVFADYAITIKTDSGEYAFTQMGNWCQPFYDALCGAYNKAVLRSLFVKESPLFTATGNYRYAENGSCGEGTARIHVYENSVVTLPPGLGARRVPLCFVTGIDKGDYELTLKLNMGEAYTYAKLGYDTAPFSDAVERQLRELHKNTLAAVKELDPSLTTAQASQIAKLMPQGMSAQFGMLAAIAPSFTAALEAEIAGTHAAESYVTLKALCGSDQIYIGFKKNETAAGDVEGSAKDTPGGNPLAALGGMRNGVTDGGQDEEAAPGQYLLWLIAPSPDGQFAAVEFAEADSATFVYRTGGNFDAFARQLNRALEAIDFKREVIRMKDAELRYPENSDYYMAAKRTLSLQFVRASFVGRVIHSGAEAWKKKLLELWEGTKAAPPQAASVQAGAKFCGQCGFELTPGMRFCGSCGAKI